MNSMLPARLGSYEPLLELASGGMASVHIARQVGPGDIERLVALKRVHPHLLAEVEFRDLFRDEARICASLRHPNIAPLIEVFEQEHELLLVFEYVEGTALSSLLASITESGERVPASVASRIVVDALAGLQAAHEALDVRGDPLGLIHRDVSPQNVLVGIDGASRLIDFGIAKIAARISDTTAVGIVRGKLAYMAPEQIKKQWLDQRADIFAAGVVLYEALTGKKPFTGEDEGDILLSVLLAELETPSSLVPGLDPAIDAVVMRALERDREARFATAAEFQEALERALPPASHREVAQVVQRHRGPSLADRRRALRQLLHRPSLVPTPPIGVHFIREEHVPTATSLVVPPPPAPQSRTSGIIAAVMVAFVALAITGWKLTTKKEEPLMVTQTAKMVANVAPAPSAEEAATLYASPVVELVEDAGAAPAPAPVSVKPRARVAPTVRSNDLHRNPYGSR